MEWLREAYLELAQKAPLDFKKLQPAEPYSSPLDGNWEENSKKWEANSRNWEMLTRIFYFQTTVASIISSFAGCRYYCDTCGMYYGGTYLLGDACLCNCRLLAMVDKAFREELKSYPGYVELKYTLPSKLPILYYICVH